MNLGRSSYSSKLGGSVIVGASNSRSRISTGTSIIGTGVSNRRAVSVYNTGSTREKRISSAGGNWSASYGSGFKDSGMFDTNEKMAMQSLNVRLAAYIEKVRTLDVQNKQLEHQIYEFNEKRAPVTTKDLSIHGESISSSHIQIYSVSLHNAKLMLQIDNARLAADDFRIKYESELAISRGVEADILGLRKVMDELTVSRRELESQITGLKEDLAYLHRSHKEELLSLRSEVGGSVSVAVERSQTADLSQTLADLRLDYEAIAEKNRKEVEAWYLQKSNALKQTVSTITESMPGQKLELTEVRRSLQSLEIEWQSLLTMKDSLERNAYETEIRYSEQLIVLQEHIDQLEDDLAQIRSDMRRQADEYALLLDVKTRLELEIATYRRLLEGEQSSVEIVIKQVPKIQTVTKTVTYIEKLIDGKVVSSEEIKQEENIQ